MTKTPISHIIALALGYATWRAIGGIGGFLVALLLVVPFAEIVGMIVSAAIGAAFSGREQADVSTKSDKAEPM